ncbi:MAG: hypothetical protein IJU87_02380, partial [Lachnospiraceae bacterium]|nr:hypothetical protein [Lachnospiraceae bacterium]
MVLASAMVFTTNTSLLAASLPETGGVPQAGDDAGTVNGDWGEDVQNEGWSVSLNGNQNWKADINFQNAAEDNNFANAAMFVKGSGSGQLNAVIKGDTDYDGISLSFFKEGGEPYVLSTSANPGDHITIDISAGETCASYEGRTYVFIPLSCLPGYSEGEYKSWINEEDSEEFVLDDAGLWEKISSFITVNDCDDIVCDLDIDDGDLIFKFYEEDIGVGTDVSLRGWSLTDENIKDTGDGYVELSQSNKEDGGDFIEGHVVSPAKNRIATVLSGTTGLKEIRLFFENDDDDDGDRKLSFGEDGRDEVVIDVERSEGFEAGEESVVMIDKEYFENTGDVDNIVMFTENTGV